MKNIDVKFKPSRAIHGMAMLLDGAIMLLTLGTVYTSFTLGFAAWNAKRIQKIADRKSPR